MNKPTASIAFLAAVIPAIAAPVQPSELELTFRKLDRLFEQLEIRKINDAIKAGATDRYTVIAVKGFPNGLKGWLERNGIVVNPQYSSAYCDYNVRHRTAGKDEPGCVITLNLARRQPNGSLRNIGVEANWGYGFQDQTFGPNNSVWAKKISDGMAKIGDE